MSRTVGQASRSKRELQLAVLLCLSGAGLVLLAGSQAWLVLVQDGQPAFAPRRTPITGRSLEPGVQALGYVGLAGVVALSATRRSGRTLVGLLLLASGAAIVALLAPELGHLPRLLRSRRLATPGTRVYDHLDTSAWPYCALAGGLLLALAGLLVSVRGRRWAALSGRSVGPAARADAAAPARPVEPRPEVGARPAHEAGPTREVGPAHETGAAHEAGAVHEAVAAREAVAGGEAGPARGGTPGDELEPGDRKLWDALDRGEDPTVPSSEGSTRQPHPRP